MAAAQVGDIYRGESRRIPGSPQMTAPGADGQPTTNGQSSSDRSWEEAITAAVTDICDRRAVIEQVKGVLMHVYCIDADAAFEMLRRRSQETNVKLRNLAAQLMTDFCSETAGDGSGLSRSAVDRILRKVHERV